MSGPFGSSQWMYASGGFYNGVATQSLRFDDGSSAYLSRTGTTTGNRKTWTWSGWVKRANLTGATQYIASAFYATSSGRYNLINFNSNNALNVWTNEYNTSSSATIQNTTSAVFRDVGAWYHIVISVDTTQVTPSNRLKIYVNGVSQSYSGDTIGLNQDTFWNGNDTTYRIGEFASSSYLDGYMAEVNFIDGTAIGDSDADGYLDEFGEIKNGVWIPKAYTGSYGTNGFRLQFNQTGTGTGSATTIGADTSGVSPANHWDSFGIDTEDCDMLDSPENNFATANSIRESTVINGSVTLSEGNLQSVDSGTTYGLHWTSNFEMSSGKWYWEVLAHTLGGAYGNIGICNSLHRGNTAGTGVFYGNDGKRNPATFNAGVTTYGASYTNGDIIGVAFDADNETVTFYKNNASQGAVGSILTQANGGYFAGVGDAQNSTTYKYVANFGQDSSFAGNKTSGSANAKDANGIGDFFYSPPSGYLALCTANISDDDLPISPNAGDGKQADDYFNTTLYQSDNIGAGGTQSITDVGFQPDWVWIKNRDTSATSHTLFDSVRLAGKMLQSDNDSLEATNSQYGYLSSFDSDGSGGGGFTLTGGTTNANFINQGTDDYVSWNWKAGGTAVLNEQGSINSNVSANTDVGFSIVTYTGSVSGVPATIGHGLGKTPRMIIVKSRSATGNWAVYHEDLNPNSSYNHAIFLDLPNQKSSATNAYWGGNTMTLNNNLFSVNNSTATNTNGVTYVAYCFAEIEGFSKFGSYTGNSSTDGTFVYTGFRPAWVMVKITNGTNNWFIFDNARDTFNVTKHRLLASDPASENDNLNTMDFLSNGFKFRDNNTAWNGSYNYIYMAFAETPTKYSLAR